MKYMLEGEEVTRADAADYAARFGYEFEKLEASMIEFIDRFCEDGRCDWFGLSFIK